MFLLDARKPMNNMSITPHNEASLKATFLEHMLHNVPFDGWTLDCFYHTAKQLNLPKPAARELFRNTLADIVDYFMRSIDAEMATRLKEQNIASLRIRDRIKTAVQTRLAILTPYRPHIERLVSYYSLHPCQATQSLYQTTDTIWHLAGDTTTDYNHYSKRILLGMVYSSTLLYWLKDNSTNYEDSWHFLDRRIENVLNIGKIKQALKQRLVFKT